MLPKGHILFGAIFSLILFLFFNISLSYSVIIFLSSFLIDVDHYFFYVQRKKDWNPKRAFRWFVALGNKHKPLMLLFHNIEFLILVLIISVFYNVFFFISIGLSFQWVGDIIYMIFEDMMGTKEFIFTRYLLTKDKKKYL